MDLRSKNTISQVFVTVLGCFFMLSCVSLMKSSIKDDNKQIPPEFGKKTETLLVIRKDKKSYDRYLEKNFEKNYFGKYIIIDRSELKSNKYQNVEVYKYVFDEDYNQEYIKANSAVVAANRGMNSKQNGQSLDYGLNTYAKFQVQDRGSGVVYRTKHGTGAFSKWMRAYIKALEKAREK